MAYYRLVPILRPVVFVRDSLIFHRHCDERSRLMAAIPDFTETEQWVVETTLKERYGQPMQVQLGDSEIRLNPGDRELTEVPLVFWQADDCNFVIFKTGDRAYRCQFYFRGYQQYGTGRYEYDDISECIVSLLQTQADYVATERGDVAGKRR